MMRDTLILLFTTQPQLRRKGANRFHLSSGRNITEHCFLINLNRVDWFSDSSEFHGPCSCWLGFRHFTLGVEAVLKFLNRVTNTENRIGTN